MQRLEVVVGLGERHELSRTDGSEVRRVVGHRPAPVI